MMLSSLLVGLDLTAIHSVRFNRWSICDTRKRCHYSFSKTRFIAWLHGFCRSDFNLTAVWFGIVFTLNKAIPGISMLRIMSIYFSCVISSRKGLYSSSLDENTIIFFISAFKYFTLKILLQFYALKNTIQNLTQVVLGEHRASLISALFVLREKKVYL